MKYMKQWLFDSSATWLAVSYRSGFLKKDLNRSQNSHHHFQVGGYLRIYITLTMWNGDLRIHYFVASQDTWGRNQNGSCSLKVRHRCLLIQRDWIISSAGLRKCCHCYCFVQPRQVGSTFNCFLFPKRIIIDINRKYPLRGYILGSRAFGTPGVMR